MHFFKKVCCVVVLFSQAACWVKSKGKVIYSSAAIGTIHAADEENSDHDVGKSDDVNDAGEETSAGDDNQDADENENEGEDEDESTFPSSPFPATVKELGLSSDGKTFSPESTFVGYEVEAPLWSDGAAKFRYIRLPEGAALNYDEQTERLIFPAGAMLIKHFAAKSDGSSPIETRAMLLREDKTWAFAVYQWSADGSTQKVRQAVKMEASADWPSGYRIPSQAECLTCHKSSPSEVLGFQPSQLISALPKLAAAKVMSEALVEKIKDIPPQPKPSDTSLSIEERGLAYLNVNCAPCHRPGGYMKYLHFNTENIDIDYLVNQSFIVPGKPEQSKIWAVFSSDGYRMPLLSVVKDPLGLDVLKTWITNWTDDALPSATVSGEP